MSLAASANETALVYQLLLQAPPLHVALVVGALPSAVTVKEVGEESSPAPLRAVTLFGSVGSAAPAPKA